MNALNLTKLGDGAGAGWRAPTVRRGCRVAGAGGTVRARRGAAGRAGAGEQGRAGAGEAGRRPH